MTQKKPKLTGWEIDLLNNLCERELELTAENDFKNKKRYDDCIKNVSKVKYKVWFL